MRRTLGSSAAAALLAGLLVTGCSGPDEADESAEDSPSSSPSPSDTGSSAPATRPEVVEMLSETSAGGSTRAELTLLDDAAALTEFTAQFSSADFVEEIRKAVEGNESPEGRRLGAATVAVGCDVPPGVVVTPEGDSYTVAAEKVVDPLPNCFAPVTTVALVEVPD